MGAGRYMQVHHHTKIKLRLLRQYLYICSKVHKTKPQNFFYVDTHAGDGVAEFDDGSIELGSAKIAAENSINFSKIFIEENPENYKNLCSELAPFVMSRSNITSKNWNINEKIDAVLNMVPEYYHSFFFLDPYGPGELPFRTLKKILLHRHQYKDESKRIPEVLINFPIKRIKQNAGNLEKCRDCSKKFDPTDKHCVHCRKIGEQLCKINDDFFGGTEWQDIWRESRFDSVESREKLLGAYLNKLKPFYEWAGGFHFYVTLVEEIKAKAPLYYLIFCTSNKLGKSTFSDLKRNIEKWKKEEYIRDYYKISMPLSKWQ